MEHHEYQEWLLLSLYGELEPEEGERLARHLEECGECRGEKRELERLHALLEGEPWVEPPPALLREAREELRARLADLESPATGWRQARRPALSAAAGLALGVALGYFLFAASAAPRPALSPLADPRVSIREVRFLERGAAGEVELAFEARRRMRLRGNIQDEAVQALLALALTGARNPGVRLRAVRVLGSGEGGPPGPEVKRALITALEGDANPGVRMRALEALDRYGADREVREALLYVLSHDESSGLRVAAIDRLGSVLRQSVADQDVVRVLEQRVRQDESPYVRSRAERTLLEVKER